ncbi:uncharacterized protein [Nicotiana tomentosiformis]|uniref:uncharacterized protein n=1 Tax=Nicotiana tomentosiformis TaxID=4098 RepID=UPI00388CB5E0
MSVLEYSTSFDSLARYDPYIVATMWDMIHRFIAGLAPELTEACSTTALKDIMDISRIQAFTQNIEKGRRQQQGKKISEQGHRKRMRFVRYNEVQEKHGHLCHGVTSVVDDTWANAEQVPTFVIHVGVWGGESQSSAGRGRGRGRGSSSGGNQNYIYALADPGSTLSYITPFVARRFGIVPEILTDPFAISTLIRESIITRRVYQGCTVTVCSRQTSADLVELEMIDFDAIMGMDWLAACYATVDCRAKATKFHFLAPLMKLTQKATKFKWTEVCERSFQELKNRLTSTPVLTLPKGPDGYAVDCDASGVGLGCVLMQHRKIIKACNISSSKRS